MGDLETFEVENVAGLTYFGNTADIFLSLFAASIHNGV
jgi:hypothetical protein